MKIYKTSKEEELQSLIGQYNVLKSKIKEIMRGSDTLLEREPMVQLNKLQGFYRCKNFK